MTDDKKEIWTKHMSASAYAALMLLVGLPVWWKSTEVYRAELPYSDIELLQDLSTRQKVFILLVTNDASTTGAHTLGPQLQKHLTDSELYDITMSVRTPRKDELFAIEKSVDISSIDDMLGPGLSADLPGSLVLMELPKVLFDQSDSHIIVGRHRVLYFSSSVSMDNVASITRNTLLGEHAMKDLLKSMTDSPTRPALTDTTSKRSLSDHLDIFLSLLVPQPEYVMASWEVEEATEKHLNPFLQQLDIMVNISVKSQVLYLTALNLGEDGSGLGPEDLSLAVNGVESSLASQSSRSPALHLLVYVPTLQVSPVSIRGSTTNSFLVPGWGGVTVYNYEKEEEQVKFPHRMEVDMDHVMGVFIGQLRSLLGVKSLGVGLALPPPKVGIRTWERDLMLRQRALENILESRTTLRSLSHLLSQIPNIVIREDIATKVSNSVGGINKSVKMLEEGLLEIGFSSSRMAREESETAFFDPSLLALLYFPDDQKYAIYIPLFLPVGIPVLLSLKAMYGWLKESKTEDKDKKD